MIMEILKSSVMQWLFLAIATHSLEVSLGKSLHAVYTSQRGVASTEQPW